MKLSALLDKLANINAEHDDCGVVVTVAPQVEINVADAILAPPDHFSADHRVQLKLGSGEAQMTLS